MYAYILLLLATVCLYGIQTEESKEAIFKFLFGICKCFMVSIFLPYYAVRLNKGMEKNPFDIDDALLAFPILLVVLITMTLWGIFLLVNLKAYIAFESIQVLVAIAQYRYFTEKA